MFMEKLNLPENLNRVVNLANNLWWSWNQDIWPLFEKINCEQWSIRKNPLLCLKNAKQDTLVALSKDKEYMDLLDHAWQRFTSYMDRKNLWFEQKYHTDQNACIAYFSAEYGIHESLPIYSGGLGVLSGDHVKSSSDLGIPMAFIGLYYHEGYFNQQINTEGQQVDVYEYHSPQVLPLQETKTHEGKSLLIDVDLPQGKVFVKVWKVQVGRNPLYLLDTNIEENESEQDKKITARLYGGDRAMRISQEIVLGIGGQRALKALGLNPKAYHINEGHSAFFQLERIANVMQERNINFYEAKALCSSNCLFTTHTPVPAGNEAFELTLMQEYFEKYVQDNLKISWGEFVNLGLISEKSDYKYYSLTVLAINVSRFFNGVSELHGLIAQKMWKGLWKNVPEVENPISYITNGVHVQTWTSTEIKNIFNEFMGGDWEDQLANHTFWDNTSRIPNTVIKEARHSLKKKMIAMVREQLKQQLKRNGETSKEIAEVDSYLSENVLTIGFARRFATYKRATLIFRDPEKLSAIINNPERPVQFVFAGKAHPADKPGQAFIKQIYKFSREERFKGKIIILENYDMNISRHLVSGVDVWLNNPRRPMEASGTSGQKVPLNAGINFSVLDGWWKEGYDGKNGWVIGYEKDYPNNDAQDNDDAQNFYNTLEQSIVPLFYNDDDGSESNAWLEKCKISLISNISRYSTHRMVQDYADKFYTKQMTQFDLYQKNEHFKELEKSYRHFANLWPSVTFIDFKFDFDKGTKEVGSRYEEFKDAPSHHTEIPYDHTLPGRVFHAIASKIETKIYVGTANPEQVICEAVITVPDSNKYELITMERTKKVSEGVYLYKGEFKSKDKTPRNIRLRVFPVSEGSTGKFEMGLVAWL